jgi:hypothetical protein
MCEHRSRGPDVDLATSSEWSTVPAPGTRVLLTGAADAVNRLGGLDAVMGAAGVVDTIHRAEAFPLKEFPGEGRRPGSHPARAAPRRRHRPGPGRPLSLKE